MAGGGDARYACQVALPDLGEAGQLRIGAASVRVVLDGHAEAAAWALTYLAAGGLGRVELAGALDEPVGQAEATGHPLLRLADAGVPRGAAYAQRLRAINPDMVVALVTTMTPSPLASLTFGDGPPLTVGAGTAAQHLIAAARGDA